MCLLKYIRMAPKSFYTECPFFLCFLAVLVQREELLAPRVVGPGEMQCGMGYSSHEPKNWSKSLDLEIRVTSLEKQLKSEELSRGIWLILGFGGYLGKEATTCFPEY